ncbi:MAG: glycosyltransferase [Phycisphaerae bacterium]
MWISLLGFSVATLLLGWLLCGFAVWLRFLGDTRKRIEVPAPTSFPKISVVVPCFDEERFIADKYRNLSACDYPAEKLEIVYADGGSTDGTAQRLAFLAREDDRVRVVNCPSGGKINQLNHVLPSLTGDIVLVTDADARLASDALRWLAAEFEADPKTALVGACTSPRGGLSIERCYWAAQNRVRLLESRVSHVSIVTACCYAFRRELISSFPSDVIADDVYAAVLANSLGHRTTYSARATVQELRTPASLPEFFSHKFRKGNAVLREMLRFCYRLPEMSGCWKTIFTTCLAQQLLLPWLTIAWIALAATLANLGQFDVIGLATAALLMALLAARKSVISVELPGPTERFGPLTIVLTFGYTLAILCFTGITYTFFRQSSCYARLPGRTAETAPPEQPREVDRVPTPAAVAMTGVPPVVGVGH